MNIDYFKEFAVLAETKNYWRAAERLYLNQSTLSKHIRAMEEDLGVPLFTRTTRSVELTEYGAALLPYARTIIQAQFEYSTTLMQKKNYQNGLVTVGSIPAMAQYDIMNLMIRFQNAYPQYTVKVVEGDFGSLKTMLLQGRCDLAFMRELNGSAQEGAFVEDEAERIPYVRDRLVAVLPKAHPLAERGELFLRELEGERLCFIKEKTALYGLCCLACQEANFVPNIVFDSHRIESILEMVANGGCVALLMDYHVKYLMNSRYSADPPFRVAKVVPAVTTQISLCRLKGARLSAAARQFLEYFKTESLDEPVQPDL